MARPRNETPPVIVQVKLTLTPGLDDDLIAFFAALPARRRAGAVAAALRNGGGLAYTQDADPGADDDLDALEDFLL